MVTSGLPPTRACPQVSISPVTIICFPFASIVVCVARVRAAWWGGWGLPNGACEDTGELLIAIGIPLTSIDESPCWISPPALFLSPTRYTPGISLSH